MSGGHIFGAGDCWCGYNQHAYQSGGLNHPQAAAARDLLGAADRMRDRWAEGDDEVKRQLWTDLHTKADAFHAALDQAAAQQEDDDFTCSACGNALIPGTLHDGHDPQCGYLLDTYRDGTEGRQ